MAQAVNDHSDNNDGSGDDFGPWSRDAIEHATGANGGHQQRADQGPEHGALSTR